MKVVIAGGGTGGHLFPGIAIAEAFQRKVPGSAILFVGTDRGIEKRVVPSLGYPLETLDVEGIKGRGPAKKLGAFLKIPRSLVQSFRILRRFAPRIVIGVGGYASGPAVLAARLMAIPTAIAEQNAFPGATNRILGRFVQAVFLSFPDDGGWFPPGKTVVTGNPVRSSFRAAVGNDREGAPGGPFPLLVFGGSQGAHVINMAMVDALETKELGSIRDGLSIVHQTGTGDLERVKAAYEARGYRADCRPFIEAMPAEYRRARLLVCRSGATSVAELTAVGKAAILIPFARAVNDHQTKNARVLVRAEAARMIAEGDLSGQSLAVAIRHLYDRPEEIQRMEDRSRELGNWGAADDIVDGALALLR